MRHSSSHTIHGRLQKDIDTTIDALEASIRNEYPPTDTRRQGRGGKKRDTSDTPPKTAVPPSHTYPDDVTKKRMIWISVGCIGSMILGLWGWNMRTIFYDVSRGVYDVETPLHRAGATFDEAMRIAGRHDAQAAQTKYVTTTPTLADTTSPDTAASSTMSESPAFTYLINTLETYPTSTVSSTPSYSSTSSTRSL